MNHTHCFQVTRLACKLHDARPLVCLGASAFLGVKSELITQSEHPNAAADQMKFLAAESEPVQPLKRCSLYAPRAFVKDLLVLFLPKSLNGFESPDNLEALDFFQVTLLRVLGLEVSQVRSFNCL